MILFPTGNLSVFQFLSKNIFCAAQLFRWMEQFWKLIVKFRLLLYRRLIWTRISLRCEWSNNLSGHSNDPQYELCWTLSGSLVGWGTWLCWTQTKSNPILWVSDVSNFQFAIFGVENDGKMFCWWLQSNLRQTCDTSNPITSHSYRTLPWLSLKNIQNKISIWKSPCKQNQSKAGTSQRLRKLVQPFRKPIISSICLRQRHIFCQQFIIHLKL